MQLTVLARLVSALTSQRENAATESLAFILNAHAELRHAFSIRITNALSRAVAVSRVKTQQVASDDSRPDMALHDTEGRLVGLVEVKFWAGLTDAQPLAYLQQLDVAVGGVLIFIAPTKRLMSLTHEIENRCRVAGRELLSIDGTKLVAGNSTILLWSWSDVLDGFKDTATHAMNRAALSDVDQLQGLCSLFETTGFIPMSREELDDRDVPRRVMALADLAEAIVEAAQRANLVSLKGAGISNGRAWSGRYLALSRAGGWFGVSYRLWSELGAGPLWLNFLPNDWGRAPSVRHALAAWFAPPQPRAFDATDGRIHVPIPIVAGAERDATVDAAVEHFRAVDQAMKAAGMSLLQDSPSADNEMSDDGAT